MKHLLHLICALVIGMSAYAGKINVMSYNLWMLPYQDYANLLQKGAHLIGLTEQEKQLERLQTKARKRAAKIPAKIAPRADAFGFQEGFDSSGRNILVHAMEKLGVKHFTKMQERWSGLRLTGSGLFFMSKYPIKKIDMSYYQDPFKDAQGTHAGIKADSSDTMGDKGVMYARIQKDGKYYHLYSTHLQTRERNAHLRRAQFHRIKRLIDSKKHPKGEPVIIMGDFNINSAHPDIDKSNYQEYLDFLKILNATDVKTRAGEYPYSSEFKTDKEKQKYGSDGQKIDYMLYLNDHLKPAKAYLTVERDLGDLSDHYPIVGHFEFPGY